jgi:hypothetical protein
MNGPGRWKVILLGVLVPILWALYFAICAAPTGAPFIYEEF